MLIGLFTLIFTVILGDSDSPFVIPGAEKAINQTITDKDRKKEIKVLLKSYKKEYKGLKKYEKSTRKQVRKMMVDRSVESSLISTEFAEVMNQRNDYNQKLTDGRLSIQQKIQPDEWEEIIKRIQDVKPKKIKKQEKSEIKAKLKQDESIIGLRDEIIAVFGDETDQATAASYLDQFEDKLTLLLHQEQDRENNMIDVMYDGQASRSDIEEVIQNYVDFQSQAQESFLDLRSNLIELSNEENWTKLAKALVKFA